MNKAEKELCLEIREAYSPQTPGMYERFNKPMKQEFFEVAMRKKLYSSIEELQGDLDEWLCYYNEARPGGGRSYYGKMPLQTFRDSKSLAQEQHNELLYPKTLSDSNH